MIKNKQDQIVGAARIKAEYMEKKEYHIIINKKNKKLIIK